MAKKATLTLIDDGGHINVNAAVIAAFRFHETLYQSTNHNQEIYGVVYKAGNLYYFSEAIVQPYTFKVAVSIAAPDSLNGLVFIWAADFHSHPYNQGDQEGFSIEDAKPTNRFPRYIRTPRGDIRVLEKATRVEHKRRGTKVHPGAKPFPRHLRGRVEEMTQ